jgi:hypothetical protein
LQAGQLLKTLTADSQYAGCLNTQMLSQRLARLGRVLPDTQLAQLVLAEPELLLASRWVAVVDVGYTCRRWALR